jgi:hypothetical protein
VLPGDRAGLLAQLAVSVPSHSPDGGQWLQMETVSRNGREEFYSYGDSTGFAPVSLLMPALMAGEPNRDKCTALKIFRRKSFQQAGEKFIYTYHLPAGTFRWLTFM